LIDPGGLREEDLDPDPFKQFDKWYRDATSSGMLLPEAMAIAASNRRAEPSVRMVLLRGFDSRGFTFYTNYESQKARELQDNPVAALLFYWSQFGRQVRITGTVSRISTEESRKYFESRPRESQLSAWASRQSEVIPNRAVLEEKMRQLAAQYEGKPVPLPPFWGGLRLSPASFEYWLHRENRLHDRLRYRREGQAWRIERLSP
jgi:pyridoxamine 5'-phosphate oxidase